MPISLEENIISKLGLDDLPSDKKADLLMRMADIVQKRIALRVLRLLPESALDEYLKIADNDEIGAHTFLSKAVPSYPAILEEEIANFKKEIIS